MASYFVRSLALLIALFLFFVAVQEQKSSLELFIGGCFFLALFISAFFEKKYLELCLGLICLFPPWIGYISSIVFGFGRNATSQMLTQNPVGFWVTMVLWGLAAVSLVTFGIYKAFYKTTLAHQQVDIQITDIKNICLIPLKGNISESTIAVAIKWQPTLTKLTLRFYTNSNLSELEFENANEVAKEVYTAAYDTFYRDFDVNCELVKVTSLSKLDIDPLDGFIYIKNV